MTLRINRHYDPGADIEARVRAAKRVGIVLAAALVIIVLGIVLTSCAPLYCVATNDINCKLD